MSFQEMKIKELQKNPFVMIGDEWMLVTAAKDGRVNTMTASWGGVGIMWNKEIATIYLRPNRYTKEFVDAGERFTLSFFDGGQKKAMGLLSSISGRDEPDKISKSGLHLTEVDGQPTFEEASMVFVCRKIYRQQMEESCYLDMAVAEANYPDKDYHVMYMSEIEKVYVQK